MFEDHGQDEADLTQDDINAAAPGDAQDSVQNRDLNGQQNDNGAGDFANSNDYGNELEDGQESHLETEGGVAQVGFEAQTGIDEEEELKMKIVLYYHTLVSQHPFSVKIQCLIIICRFSFLVPRNSLPMVCTDAAAKL